jgi:hypothetical protein
MAMVRSAKDYVKSPPAMVAIPAALAGIRNYKLKPPPQFLVAALYTIILPSYGAGAEYY